MNGYASEQILSSTLFRLYRALGGDSPASALREHAARGTVYLILRAVALLTPATNPASPLGREAALEAADGGVWSAREPAETLAGGAYHKLIRWAFEKQGLFKAPGAPRTAEGAPPEVDVYIDDGRAGEYAFAPQPWTCTAIWNRHAPDAGEAHQEPRTGQTNHAYVRIQNRGSRSATGLVVRGFHAQPGLGLRFPDDYAPLSTPQLEAADLAPGASAVVGPFAWSPFAASHEPLLFSVSADDDPSNLDASITGSIAELRLVPHDNNLGLRSVHLLPLSMPSRSLTLKNPFARSVHIELGAELPALLASRGYQLQFTSASFELAEGGQQLVSFRLEGGTPLDPTSLPADSRARSLAISARADGIPIGGTSFVLDPDLSE